MKGLRFVDLLYFRVDFLDPIFSTRLWEDGGHWFEGPRTRNFTPKGSSLEQAFNARSLKICGDLETVVGERGSCKASEWNGL